MKTINISVLDKGFLLNHDRPQPPAPTPVKDAYGNYPATMPVPYPSPANVAFSTFNELVEYLREQLDPGEPIAATTNSALTSEYDHEKWERRNNRQHAINVASGILAGSGDVSTLFSIAENVVKFVDEEPKGDNVPESPSFAEILEKRFAAAQQSQKHNPSDENRSFDGAH